MSKIVYDGDSKVEDLIEEKKVETNNEEKEANSFVEEKKNEAKVEGAKTSVLDRKPWKEDEEIEENRLKDEEKTFEKKEKKKLSWPKRIGFVFLTLIALGLVTLDILLYGPNYKFRDWLVTNAMTTIHHHYLATWFYSDEEIDEVMSRNRVVEVDENTDTSLLDDKVPESAHANVEYANEYERQILEKEEDQDYKIIEIHEDNFDGYLAVIYDPSRISVATSKNLGSSGQYLVDMAKQNNASVAINGGGFADEGGNGTGGVPYGITFSNGGLKYNYGGRNEEFSIIGFDDEDRLILGRYNQSEMVDLGIRDAVTFSPFLIVNGKQSYVEGNGGWGYGPRTAIGQRSDKIVLFLVIDGRRVNKQGASMSDLIEIMSNYGAINAANLDGGTSSAMAVEGKIINDPMDASGNHRTRPVATSFLFK